MKGIARFHNIFSNSEKAPFKDKLQLDIFSSKFLKGPIPSMLGVRFTS